MYKNAGNILKVVEDSKKNNLKVVLWGAGVNGKVLLDLFEKKHVRIDEVVDKDISKQENEIYGYIIKEPQEVLENANIILATSDKIYEDVFDVASKRGIEVVNIGELIGY